VPGLLTAVRTTGIDPVTLRLPEAISWTERRAATAEPLEQLAAAVVIAEELRAISEELVDHFVTRAREADRSWAGIGDAFGISRQAAHPLRAA
jgi:hypothetical protein